MRNTIISIFIGSVLVATVGWLVYSQKSATPQVPTDTTTTTQTQSSTTPTQSKQEAPASTSKDESGITLADVAKHATRTSCWSIINGNIYDLTSWIPNHPGGEKAILQLCGTDGSEKYNRKHGGAERPTTALTGFKIGALTE